MFYILHGKDTYRSKQKLKELLRVFREKAGELSVFNIEGEGFDKEKLKEFLVSNTLFDNKYVVVCEGCLGNTQGKKFIVDNIEKFAQSKNIFIFLEGELKKEVLEKIKPITNPRETLKPARHLPEAKPMAGGDTPRVSLGYIKEFKLLPPAKIKDWVENECKEKDIKISASVKNKIMGKCGKDLWCMSKELEKASLATENFSKNSGEVVPRSSPEVRPQGEFFEKFSVAPKFNMFSICDAVANKDRKSAWIIFQEATLAGIDPEEIFWKIQWQIKNLLLIKKLNDLKLNIAEETSLHPFVIQKTLAKVNKFTNEELINYSEKLVDIYHNARLGLTDFPTAVEKFLIEM
jgi:DNA polymerase III delta subunit